MSFTFDVTAVAIMRNHPIVFGVAATLVGTVLGGLLGWLAGAHETNSIAVAVRTTNPNDPLDGLPILFLGFVLLGAFFGFLAGAITGGIAYARFGRGEAGTARS